MTILQRKQQLLKEFKENLDRLGISPYTIKPLAEEFSNSLDDISNMVVEEVRKDVVKFIWDHRTADNGDIIFAKFSKKDLDSLSQEDSK